MPSAAWHVDYVDHVLFVCSFVGSFTVVFVGRVLFTNIWRGACHLTLGAPRGFVSSGGHNGVGVFFLFPGVFDEDEDEDDEIDDDDDE